MKQKRAFEKPVDMILRILVFSVIVSFVTMRSTVIPLGLLLVALLLFLFRIVHQRAVYQQMTPTEKQIYLENRSRYEYRPKDPNKSGNHVHD